MVEGSSWKDFKVLFIYPDTMVTIMAPIHVPLSKSGVI